MTLKIQTFVAPTNKEAQDVGPMRRGKTKAFVQKTKEDATATQEENLELMPMMMTNIATIKDQIYNLTKIVEGLVIQYA